MRRASDPPQLPEVRLARLSPREYARFVHEQIVEHAEQMDLAGTCAPEEALDRAVAELEPLLDGSHWAAGHGFYKGVDPVEGGVGWAWLGPPSEKTRLHQLTVHEPLLGRGYGASLLRAVEAEARRRGARELVLDVSRWNATAIRLFERAGYLVVKADGAAQRMAKRLGPP